MELNSDLYTVKWSDDRRKVRVKHYPDLVSTSCCQVMITRAAGETDIQMLVRAYHEIGTIAHEVQEDRHGQTRAEAV